MELFDDNIETQKETIVREKIGEKVSTSKKKYHGYH